MKTAVIYYSYGGNTRAVAEGLAESEGAELIEIKDKRRPSKARAYSAGCLGAIRGSAWASQPLGSDLADFEKLIFCSPIWASNVPPVVNVVLKALPSGKIVAFRLVSASGKSECSERLGALVAAAGSTLEGIEDVKK
ncbi:MAG: hypothetical protein LBN99_07865 [Oscillospiraceae bacterium]|jgi:flavodoxin|nr:hypothetical protein [Oscillospiraceae bacterium]